MRARNSSETVDCRLVGCRYRAATAKALNCSREADQGRRRKKRLRKLGGRRSEAMLVKEGKRREKDTGSFGFRGGLGVVWVGPLGWCTFSSPFRRTRKKVGRGGNKSWGCCYRARFRLDSFGLVKRRIASACGRGRCCAGHCAGGPGFTVQRDKRR